MVDSIKVIKKLPASILNTIANMCVISGGPVNAVMESPVKHMDGGKKVVKRKNVETYNLGRKVITDMLLKAQKNNGKCDKWVFDHELFFRIVLIANKAYHHHESTARLKTVESIYNFCGEEGVTFNEECVHHLRRSIKGTHNNNAKMV